MNTETFDQLMGAAEAAGKNHLEQCITDGVDQPHMIYWFGTDWSGQMMLIGPTETWAGFTRRAVAPFSPKFVVVVADSYATDNPAVHKQGALSELFRDGHPNVSECLALMATDGTTYQTVQKLYRRRGNDIEWCEHLCHTSDKSEIDGLVVDALNASFDDCADPWAGVSFITDLRLPAVLLGPGFMGVPERPGRNELCPCGSGRKSNVCHW
jgi:hypothetical protein